MIPLLISFLIAGVAALALLTAFMSLVPRLVKEDKTLASFLIQWTLILILLVPAMFGAMLGPLWIYQVLLEQDTTKDDRFWLILGSCALSVVWFLAALRSSAGRAYSSWRSLVG
ncbi:MAG: hypothetical protein OEX15_02165 [Gammaproteobacteria bacterium]|nr:hypothetical protein [Gammaproteobacteria bacterium]